MYEIFFFDIDGTLRSFETHEVPASAREALARLRGRGAKVIIATGRDRRSLPPLEGLTFDGYILVNGGHCLTTDGEVLAERPIPMEILDRMLHVGMREGFPVSMLTDEGMVASSVNDGMRDGDAARSCGGRFARGGAAYALPSDVRLHVARTGGADHARISRVRVEPLESAHGRHQHARRNEGERHGRLSEALRH